MSSNSGLSRARSLRKPAAINAGSANQKENTKLAPSSSNDPGGIGSPSRLPQVKPLTRAATTTATTSTSTRARTTNPTRTSTKSAAAPPPSTIGSTRPLSGVLGSRNGLATTRRASPTTAENTAAAAARPLGRTPSTRPAPSAPSASANIRSASRESSASTQRPSSSGGASSTSTLTRSKTLGLGHARAKSTATGLTAATTLKPPSSRVSTAASSTVSAKPQTRSQTLQARGATHRASASTSSATATATAATAAAPPAGSQSRPAFNTNQQHYSPLKSHAPKPLTSTFLAPPSPSKLPANVAITAETARLQTELLQLSLLHRDAGATAAEWHESAQRKLGARFGELARAEQALGCRERDGVEARNAAVLLRWGAARASTEVVGGLEEKVQMLDQVVNGVWRFGEPGGRYARVVEEFEHWAGRLQGIMEARRKGDVNSLLGNGLDDTDEVLFIGDLENRWRDECPGLVRKLEEWRRMLRHLGPVPDRSGDAPAATSTEDGEGGGGGQKSSLARILEGCTSMVDDMLAELALMEQMVREAVRAEDDWIEVMNKELNLGKETDSQGDRSAPLWKMVV
ncbi:uncharacterized protein PG986_013410 [Apiospora aurea]|uniref:Uncharacterized protein n=1 Tax=Apiospora aurea TaxID=335848 RepID=A0ABR1PVG6_9PEZI